MPLRAAVPVAVLLAVGACGDAPTEPAALIVAQHARAALDVSVPLPSLTDAEAMDAAAFAGVLRDLGVWLDAAEAGLARGARPTPATHELRAELDSARRLLAEAARLEAAHDREAAVASLLGAEAWLLRTTTLAVAEGRLAAAAAAEARCEAAESGAVPVTVERGRRLLAHAREAMAEGDAERALQRAHYAAAMLTAACTETKRNGGVR